MGLFSFKIRPAIRGPNSPERLQIPPWIGFEAIQNPVDPQHRKLSAPKPAVVENQTLRFPDLSNARDLLAGPK